MSEQHRLTLSISSRGEALWRAECACGWAIEADNARAAYNGHEAVELLRRVEWVLDTSSESYCPVCENGKPEHYPDCDLADLLVCIDSQLAEKEKE